MGHRKIPTVYTLDDIEGEEGLVVRIKSLRVGKLRKLIRAVESDEGVSDSLDEFIELIAENLVSWTLEDENGVPVPADLSGVEDLEMDVLMGILSAWLGKLTGVDKELGKDSSSGEKFPGQLVTMEAL